MSAIHLDAEHLAAIVGSTIARDRWQQDDLTVIAALLARENARSFGYRYDEPTEPVQVPAARVVYYTLHPLAPAAVLKALDSYEYQTCEHPEWEASEARKWCDHARSVATDALPGYEAAEWVIRDGARVARAVRS